MNAEFKVDKDREISRIREKMTRKKDCVLSSLFRIIKLRANNCRYKTGKIVYLLLEHKVFSVDNGESIDNNIL